MKLSVFLSSLRAFLVLSRAGYVPTVWSNTLAGWWLGGGGNLEDLPFLFSGVTFLYFGGTFLNDAFDVAYDRDHRRVRPIPAGEVPLALVRRWGWGWLALGATSLFGCGWGAGGVGLALALCIVLYNAIHRLVTFSPLVLGICRFYVYLVAAATGVNGVTGWPIWCGLALAAYVTGVGWFNQRETQMNPPGAWPGALLVTPIGLALIMNTGTYREAGLLLAAVLGLWVLRSLRPVLWSPQRNLAGAVSGLWAGVVLVDWLAVADAPRELSAQFILLFVATLLFQRATPTV